MRFKKRVMVCRSRAVRPPNSHPFTIKKSSQTSDDSV